MKATDIPTARAGDPGARVRVRPTDSGGNSQRLSLRKERKKGRGAKDRKRNRGEEEARRRAEEEEARRRAQAERDAAAAALAAKAEAGDRAVWSEILAQPGRVSAGSWFSLLIADSGEAPIKEPKAQTYPYG